MARIMHVTHTGNPGGAERILVTLAEQQAKDHDVIVGLVKEGWLSRELTGRGIRHILIPRNRGADITFVVNLVKALRSEKIDLVHSHLLDTNFYASIAARFAGIPHVCTEHGEVNRFKEKMPLKVKIKLVTIAALSRAVVFVSSELMRNWISYAPIRGDKAHIIRNGCRTQGPSKERRQDARRLLGIPDSTFVIGNVGSLLPVKGQTYLLEAISESAKRIPDILCLIAGRGPLEGDLRKRISELHIDRYIRLLGYREDTQDLMAAMDTYVLSSTSEGLPLALIEAMGASLPVIVSDIESMREIIRDGDNGYLVTTRSGLAFAQAIWNVYSDRKAASDVGRAGLETVRSSYSAETMARGYEDLYRSLGIRHRGQEVHYEAR